MTKFEWVPLTKYPEEGSRVKALTDIGKEVTEGKCYTVIEVDSEGFWIDADDGWTRHTREEIFDDWLIRKPVEPSGGSEEFADNVNSPSHYTQGNVEVIDIIEQTVSGLPSERAYQLGNVIKYISRHPHKNGKEDLEKAAWYLQRAIDQYEDVIPDEPHTNSAP